MQIGVLLPSRFEDPGEFLADARALEAAGVDSVWIADTRDGFDPLLVLAAIAAVTSQLRLGLIRGGSPSPLLGGTGRGFDTLQQLSRQRFIAGPERWRRVDVPADREAWAKSLDEAEGATDGVIVPMDPRLLDILRHPTDAIDRSDLILAQG
jgi:alkanesulfonate monooxygenase SsuD/methylene tetrahydromethanopterin reductase-like flavin-dependent oxidoreductase (luciferase family)